MNKIILLLIVIQSSMLIADPLDEWIIQPSSTNNQLNCIYMGNSWWGWVAGNNGTILRNVDYYNSTWVPHQSGTSYNLYAISSNLDRVWAAGANGTILMTTNNGDNWTTVSSGVNVTLRSITWFSSNKVWVVGDNGTILRSTNKGVNWSLIPFPTTLDLNSISYFYNEDIIFAAGKNGVILKSTNLGVSWNLVPSGTSNNLNKITHARSYDWVAGNNGMILRSSDHGNSWTVVNSGTTVDLLSISFPDSIYGWACGMNGKILRTTNGGITWLEDFFGSINTMNDIDFPTENYGWVVGSNGLILHTELGVISRNAMKLDANTINAWYSNWGSFNYNPLTWNSGFEWPKGSHKTARYSSGPWLGAKVGGDTLVVIAEYSREYFPGYTDNNGIPSGRYDTSYKVYKLTSGVNNIYRQKWPNALLGNSDQGAPVYYDEQLHSWKPLDYADQTMFYSYTDSYPESHISGGGSTAPLKADIKQINFAFDEPGALGNIQYCQFMIINRSHSQWNDTYISIWADDDLGNATDDKVGCDTLLDMGYTYNGIPVDPIYGSNPPAVAFVLIKGPAVYTGNNNDTAFLCFGKTKKIKVGYKQRHMSVFRWQDDTYEPMNYVNSYRMMQGIDRFGMPIINPVTGKETKFMYSGDPVTNTGWIQQGSFEQKFVQSVGPITMNSGDTQYIVMAQVIAQGTSNLNSISVLRQYAQLAKDYYNNCFYNVPIGIENTQNQIPIKFSLEQNFPNPFNPITKIKFSIPASPVPSQRVESSTKGGVQKVRLIIYDILGREVATLIPPLLGGQEGLKPGNYEVEWDGSNFASGVYFYKLEAGYFSLTKKMVLIK